MDNTTQTKVKPETLTYVRVARKAKDGQDGFIYLHHWGTGWQELIYSSHEAAKKAQERMNKKAT
jgi:hypothetical protein